MNSILVKRFLAAASGMLLALYAYAADLNNFVLACKNNTDMSQEMCECSAGKAQNELSESGFNFVVSALNKDDAETTKLRSQMPANELLPAATFLLRAPRDCAEELHPE